MKTSCIDVYGKKVCSSGGCDFGCSYFEKSAYSIHICMSLLHGECIDERAFPENNVKENMGDGDRDVLIGYLIDKMNDMQGRLHELELIEEERRKERWKQGQD